MAKKTKKKATKKPAAPKGTPAHRYRHVASFDADGEMEFTITVPGKLVDDLRDPEKGKRVRSVLASFAASARSLDADQLEPVED